MAKADTTAFGESALAGLAAEAAMLRAAFRATPQPLLLVAVDPPKFTMVAVNEAHARAFSTTAVALAGHGVYEVFGPEPGPEALAFREAIRELFDAVVSGRQVHEMATRPYAVTGPDGVPVERYWSATNAPVFDAERRLSHIISTVRDVTGEVQERQSEEARRLLMHEVDHRSRNALALAQSFVRLTNAADVEGFRERLGGRLQALARAQTSLAARKWEGALLGDIVHATVGGLLAGADVRIAGPALVLAASQVQATTMLLHELATNAVKHGSLSRPGGALEIIWSVGGEDQVATLQWIERGGHPVARPERSGFGARLVQQLVRQLQGEFVADWSPEGLCATLTFTAGWAGLADLWAEDG